MTSRTRTELLSLSRLAQIAFVAVGVWAGAAAENAYADGPVGWSQEYGNVAFSYDAGTNTWTITQFTGDAIYNYDSFDVDFGTIVNFLQPSALARLLNRVNDDFDGTQIGGEINANGIIYFVNPAGVYFTGDAVVNAAGGTVYAIGGTFESPDFINGDDVFSNLVGEVINEGLIHAGQIHLIGDRVANHGHLSADTGGIITMIAGDTVMLQPVGDRIMVKVDGHWITDQSQPYGGTTTPDLAGLPGVENTGTIEVEGGQIVLGAGDLYSLAIRNTGTIQAPEGDITIAATDGLIQNDGLIDAGTIAGNAGTIVIQGPSILNRGEIRADASMGFAGDIEVASRYHTYLTPGSIISANGGNMADGGNIFVYSYDGLTIVAEGAVIDASGGAWAGDGGSLHVGGDSLWINGTLLTGASEGFNVGETLITCPGDIIFQSLHLPDEFLTYSNISFDNLGDGNGMIWGGAFPHMNGFIHVVSDGNIFVGRYLGTDLQVDLLYNNDMLLEAAKVISVRAPINGAHDIWMYADTDDNGYGWVSINVPLVIGNNALFSGTDIYLQGHSILSGGTQDYYGRSHLGTDYVLTGTDITFHGTLNSNVLTPNRSLLVNTTGHLTFEDAVGGNSPLRYLEVNGATNLNGGLVVTNEYQHYLGAVTLGSDNDLVSNDGGDIRFAGTLNGPHFLNVYTSGLTSFEGRVGGAAALAGIHTDAPGETLLATTQMTGGTFDFDDDVLLGANVHLNASNLVDFGATVTGNDYNLIVNAPLTAFHGNVTGVDLLRTDADGVTTIDAAKIFGRRLDFNDVVVLARDAFLRGDRYIDFDQTVDGPYALRLMSDWLVRFGGDVGSIDALASLRTDVGGTGVIDRNLVVIDGNLIRVNGDILFNPGGKIDPALVATIAGHGDLMVQSLNGDILMGPNEKLTTLGDLTLSALNGMITAGDLNCMGDMAVLAPLIRLRARDGGSIYDAGGHLIIDNASTYIAGGSIDFSSVPVVIGSGLDPIFATRSGSGVSGTLSGFAVVSKSDLASGDFMYGEVLDLTAGATSETNLAEALSSIGKINDRVELDPFALRAMEQLGIDMRALSSGELLDTTGGMELYNDAPVAALGDEAGETSATNRLRRSSVLAVLDRHAAIFVREREDPDTGEMIREDRTDEVRAALAAAWDAYAAEAGEAADAAGFRAYIAEHEEHAEALAYVDGLRDMFRELWVMGSTPREMRRSLDGVLAPIAPEAMGQVALEEAIEIETVG